MNKGFGPRVLELRAQGWSYRRIAKEVGCSRPTVSFHCSKLETNKELASKLLEEHQAHVRRTLQVPRKTEAMLLWLLEDGVSRVNIADALGLPYDQVLRFAETRGMRRRPALLSQYEYVRRRRRHLKMLAVAHMGGQCIRCGYHKSIRSLSFHHRDPDGKDFSISQNANRAWAAIKEELIKCIMLCSNCHQEEHDMYELYAPSIPCLE
jgi:transcriptional regulator with XRE-family HTH domain